MKQPRFSIILPLYKQANHVEQIVKSYTRALRKLKAPHELILVINGLQDSAGKIARQLAKKNSRLRVYELTQSGWGRAVRYGLSHARGQYLCYTNSARTNLQDLLTILKYAQVNRQVIIKATRMLRMGLLRRIGSVLYNFECRLLLKIPVWDVNGTPKVIPRKLLKRLKLRSSDDLIDAELIANATRQRLPILEIPIVNNARISGGSTTNFRSALKLYLGVLKLAKQI